MIFPKHIFLPHPRVQYQPKQESTQQLITEEQQLAAATESKQEAGRAESRSQSAGVNSKFRDNN